MEIYGNSGCYNNDMPITGGMMFLDNGMVVVKCYAGAYVYICAPVVLIGQN